MNKHNYVAIMAGGIGSRFWPGSRVAYPKQFLDVLNTGKSLIQLTYERYSEFIPASNIFVVTSEGYADIVAEHLPEIPNENIVSEPSRKNTAACVAYISFKIAMIDPAAILIVAPSDHIILDQTTFRRVALRALDFAGHNNSIVTLGIKPTHANTGYGYIQYELAPVSDGIFKVKTFTEKPNADLATAFLASGDFLWNGGIFIWGIETILQAFHDHQPEVFELFYNERDKLNTQNEQAAIEKIYSLCTNISIDVAVIEKAENVYVIPSSFGWSDLGSWNSAYDNLHKDAMGNALSGDKILMIQSSKCMVSADNRKLVVLQGMDNYIIVDTADTLFICKKENEQSIKEYTTEVRRLYGERFL